MNTFYGLFCILLSLMIICEQQSFANAQAESRVRLQAPAPINEGIFGIPDLNVVPNVVNLSPANQFTDTVVYIQNWPVTNDSRGFNISAVLNSKDETPQIVSGFVSRISNFVQDVRVRYTIVNEHEVISDTGRVKRELDYYAGSANCPENGILANTNTAGVVVSKYSLRNPILTPIPNVATIVICLDKEDSDQLFAGSISDPITVSFTITNNP